MKLREALTEGTLAAGSAAGCGSNVEYIYKHYYIVAEAGAEEGGVGGNGGKAGLGGSDAGVDTESDAGGSADSGSFDSVAEVETSVPDGNLEEDFLTRGELIKSMVFDVMQFPKGECSQQSYPDVPVTDDLCYAHQVYAKLYGGPIGSPDGFFSPDVSVVYAELWKFMVSGLGFAAYRAKCAEQYAGVNDVSWFADYGALCDKQIPLYGNNDLSKEPGDAVKQKEWEVIKDHLNSYFGWTLTRADLAELITVRVKDAFDGNFVQGCISDLDDVEHHTKDCVTANYVVENGFMLPFEVDKPGKFFFPDLDQKYGLAAMWLVKPMGFELQAPNGCSGIAADNFFAWEVDTLCNAGLIDSKWADNVELNIPRLEAYKAAWKYAAQQ